MTRADVIDRHAEAAVAVLRPAETEQLAEVAARLAAAADGAMDAPHWLAAAGELWEETPVALRRAVRAFRRNPGPHGVLLLRGLPAGSDGPVRPTPSVPGSVQRIADLPAAVLVLVASGLGDPAAYRPEKAGAIVQDVVPVPGSEQSQSNAGSTALMFHTENAFHPHRPDFVLLNCRRADPDGVAGLRTAGARALLPHLDEDTRRALAAEEYHTEPPPSFGRAGEPAAHAVLTGTADDPDLRVDLAATRAVTDRARAALARLTEVCDARALATRLVAGDLAVVDNRTTLHGRTAFRPRYDGTDRWLQRVFVLTDLRRSRASRPADGHVLES